jgi:hypothetical protein
MPGQSTLNAYTVAPGGQGCEPHWVPVFCFPRVKVPSGRWAYPVTAKVIAASSASSRSVTPRPVNLYIFWSTKFVIVSKPGRIRMIHVLGVFPSPGDSFPCEPPCQEKGLPGSVLHQIQASSDERFRSCVSCQYENYGNWPARRTNSPWDNAPAPEIRVVTHMKPSHAPSRF